jgi:hypothetical protein
VSAVTTAATVNLPLERRARKIIFTGAPFLL